MLNGTVVLKENRIQLVTDQYGDVPAGNSGGLGLYFSDTRYLSCFELRVNAQQPIYLSHNAERNYIATFQFVNPLFTLASGQRVPRQTISIRRSRFVDARAYYERLGFYNCNQFAVDLDVTLHFDADFRDIFAVRGYAMQRLAGRTTSTFGPEGLVFSYVGRDKLHRRTLVGFSTRPEPVSANTMLFSLQLEPHQPLSVTVSVQPSIGRARPARPLRFDAALERLGASYARWHGSCTDIATDNEFFDRSLLRQSRLDIRALLEFEEPDDKRRAAPPESRSLIPSAGIPWYAVPFGRDSIITALQTLIYNPGIAEGTLRFLARHQGEKCDAVTEEEPGKILHELRRGELANLREVPHVPYFGTVDATPLFVVLFVETMAWLDSDDLYRDVLPHAMRALSWIDNYGDLDGDGYVEYVASRSGGVANQGWKDSVSSLQYEDGENAHLPAALVEVQGYVYQAKMGLSKLAGQRGDVALRDRLEAEAQQLKSRFDQDFWMPDHQFFAQALDADKRQIRSVTSNPGHCLWSGIIDVDKAALVVERLMAPDMFSGWGVRTLSSASPNYNPMSYHNGSVWPHDNSLIALGMQRYGHRTPATAVISSSINAGLRFPGNRLPELFCGFPRDRRFDSSPASYIVSCSPQAWSAAAPFLFLQTLLDISPADGRRTLQVNPAVNDLFHAYRLHHLRTGAGRVSFEVAEAKGETRIRLLAGDVAIRSETATVE